MKSRQPAHFTVKIPGSARGLPDRVFKVTVSETKGITVRHEGSSSSATLTWRQLMAQVLLHFGELP